MDKWKKKLRNIFIFTAGEVEIVIREFLEQNEKVFLEQWNCTVHI